MITGVISSHNIDPDLLEDIFTTGIDLDYEDYIKENGEDAGEYYEAQEPTIIYGFIKDEKTGKYAPDLTADISVIYNTNYSTIQVVHSKYVKDDCLMCSPCYPGQADLDSDGGILTAYCFPVDDLAEDVDAKTKSNIRRDVKKNKIIRYVLATSCLNNEEWFYIPRDVTDDYDDSTYSFNTKRKAIKAIPDVSKETEIPESDIIILKETREVVQ